MIRTVLTAAAAVLALAGCAGPAPAPQAQPVPHVIDLDLPAIPPAAETPAAPDCGNYCGTDAGLVGPAPRVQDLEAAEAATVPVVPPVVPVPVVPAPPAAPVVVAEPAVEDAEQLAEESGGRAIDCEDGTVAAQTADGTVTCGSQS